MIKKDQTLGMPAVHAMCLESAVDKPAPGWADLVEKMKAWKLAKSEKAGAPKAPAVEAANGVDAGGSQMKQPVPTPARAMAKASDALAKYTVPSFVLESLAAKAPLPPEPFAVTGGEQEGEGEEKTKKKPVKAPAKTAKTKASCVAKMKLAKIACRKTKKKCAEIAGPEVEQALALLPAEEAQEPHAQIVEAQETVSEEKNAELVMGPQYKPKACGEARKCYIDACRKEGLS